MKKFLSCLVSVCIVFNLASQDAETIHLGAVEAEAVTYNVTLDSPRVLSYCVDGEGNRITER